MKISVIIPVYRVEAYLRQCVDSVLEQTYRDIEVILVDDGSPDDCPRICDEYAHADERVRVIHQKNSGISEARGTGLAVSTGDYITFVDADDWIDRELIGKCAAIVEADADVGCVLYSYTKESGRASEPMQVLTEPAGPMDREASRHAYRRLFGLTADELGHPERMENMGPCWNKLYRRDYCEQGRMFDINEIGSSEDTLFNLYALAGCEHMTNLAEPLYHYRKHSDSVTATYREGLAKKWDHLFDLLQGVIDEYSLDSSCQEALNNRIALSITAIGMNEMDAPSKTWLQKRKAIRDYISQPRYQRANRQIKRIRRLPILWRILVLCGRYRMATAICMAMSLLIRIRKNYLE